VLSVKRRCDRIPIHTYRTHNRNRSLSFINSDQLVNVSKGSRQIKPVTLGKRLALMIGHQVNLDCLSTAMIAVVIVI
jgi:hypothetical protein